MTLEDTITAVKFGALVVAGVYVWNKGLGGIAAELAGYLSKKAEAAVGAATKETTFDINGSIQVLKDTGFSDDEAKTLELLALGNLGA